MISPFSTNPSLTEQGVLGTIGFDDKGDVYGYEPFVWYVWLDGNYAPVDPAEPTD